MAITGIFQVKAILLFGLTLFSCVANGAVGRRSLLDSNTSSGSAVFDVTTFGAKADGKTDSALAFIKTWRAACDSTSPAKMLIPEGTFLAGPVVFQGPCKTEPVTLDVQGNVQATSDLSEYTSPEWISFEVINSLILKGTGTFDGQGSQVWQYNDCDKNKGCQTLPDSLKFHRVNNSMVSGITSLNSKFFHYHVIFSSNVTFTNLHITAPGESPNTDGIHISNSKFISVTNSVIATGDDCVSVGQGVNNLTVNQVACGPGHGISVGSLGKYPNEKDVSGIFVSNCSLSNTTNGVRIKSYPASSASLAATIIFKDIIMKNVKNPIIIDQHYGNKVAGPSKVKISDVHFRNIRGTSISPIAVSLMCSSAVPCEGVELADIDLSYTGIATKAYTGELKASCENVKVAASGKQNPATCP